MGRFVGSILFILLALYTLETTGKATPKNDCQAKLTECLQDDNSKRPVCGQDNQTYSNACQLLKQQCDGNTVTLKHKGPCRDIQPCLASREYALKMKKPARGVKALFVPKCREDGSYAPVQCHGDTGCWCVTAQGKPVPNTSVRNGRPNCGKSEKSNTRRRSSMWNQKTREGCSRTDKSQFNKNLIDAFCMEYDRLNPSASMTLNEKNKIVIEWKFNSMDKNKNDQLEKPEYSQLRLIKKVVKPKRCAKTFARLCDLDHDEVITRQEWTNCISDDTHNYEGGARAPGANTGHSKFDDIKLDEKNDDDDDDQENDPTGVLQGSLKRISAHLPGYGDDILDKNRDDTDSNDCLSDRKSVLDELKNGDNVTYVPECMADGRFQRMQCYPSTGYCWCVHEDTGKPIPGTSLKDQRPNCDALPAPNRPMKGCPEQRKVTFLRELMEFLRDQMISSTNGTGIIGPKWQASREEQIATWSFVMLDQNQNKVLERKEWKLFRTLVMRQRQLRRCGKKLPRYCDVNHDRKISITEWLNCLNAQKNVAGSETANDKATTLSNRKGPNPLESYLKAD